MRTTDLKSAIDDINDAFGAFVETRGGQIDQLQERLEELEAGRALPGKSGGRKAVDHKVYHTPHGPIFELPNHVKMADVLPATKEPPVTFERWLGAALVGEKCNDREAVEFAREQKQIVTTSTGVLIPQEYQSRWIDLIRSNMVLNSAGMTTVTMEAKTQNHSAVATDPAATWHTEAGSISADNPTFVARSLTAQTLVTRCTGSVEVSQDSPDFGAQLAGVMARAMAVELDRVGLVGSGSPPEPQGILGADDIGRVQGVGSIDDYSDLLEAVRTLLAANVPLDIATANAIMSPSVWATFEGLVTGISGDKTQLPRPRSLETTRFLVTTNDLDTGSPLTSTAFMGDFRDLVLGVRREASVEALKLTTYASNLVLEFVGYLRADYMIRRPSSFVTIEGISV